MGAYPNQFYVEVPMPAPPLYPLALKFQSGLKGLRNDYRIQSHQIYVSYKVLRARHHINATFLFNVLHASRALHNNLEVLCLTLLTPLHPNLALTTSSNISLA